jgi:ABC-type branched-subunit amino acid transport system substrate-binding protein
MVSVVGKQRLKRRVAIATAVVAAGAVLAACSSSGGGTGTGSSNSSGGGATSSGASTTSSSGGSKTVKIGFLVAETGPIAAALKPELDGAKAAIAWLNAGNGTPGVKYVLEDRDNKGDPNQDAVQGRALIADGIQVLVGDVGSTPGLEAVQPAVNQAKIVSIGTSTDDTMLSKAGDGKEYPWLFTVQNNTEDWLSPDLKAAEAATKNHKIAQIAMNLGSVPDWVRVVNNAAKTDGFSIATQNVAATATDVKSQLRQLQSSGADTLFVWAYGALLQTMLTNLDQIGWYPNIVTVPDAARPAIQAALSDKIKPKMVAGPAPKTFITPGGAKPTGLAGTMVDEYLKVTGAKLGSLDTSITSAAIGFDMILAVDFGVKNSNGGTTPDAIKSGLISGATMTGSLGTFSWTADKRDGAVEGSQGVFDPSKPCGQGACAAPAS